jgi:hypothetical protein
MEALVVLDEAPEHEAVKSEILKVFQTGLKALDIVDGKLEDLELGIRDSDKSSADTEGEPGPSALTPSPPTATPPIAIRPRAAGRNRPQ